MERSVITEIFCYYGMNHYKFRSGMIGTRTWSHNNFSDLQLHYVMIYSILTMRMNDLFSVSTYC